MANRQKGEVSFDAKGKTWVMCFSVNAMCEIEAETGMPIVALANSLQDENGVSLTVMRTLFHHGVVDCDSAEMAGELMHNIGINKVGDLIGEAFGAAFPDASDEVEGKPTAATK